MSNITKDKVKQMSFGINTPEEWETKYRQPIGGANFEIDDSKGESHNEYWIAPCGRGKVAMPKTYYRAPELNSKVVYRT
jgi:hypothetical protein